MMKVPAGIPTISSWAGSLARSAAIFFPSGVHSLVTSATSSAHADRPMWIKPPMITPVAIPRLRTIGLPVVASWFVWLFAWILVELFQRLKVHRQIEQVIGHGAHFHMLILDNPTSVFLGQLHRKLKIGRDPLVILLNMFALFGRHFVQDRRMPFAHFRANFLSGDLALEERPDAELLVGIVGQRFEMLHS